MLLKLLHASFFINGPFSHQACQESLGWLPSMQGDPAYKQREFGVTLVGQFISPSIQARRDWGEILGGQFSTRCCWYKKCKVLLLGVWCNALCFILHQWWACFLAFLHSKHAMSETIWTYEPTTITHHPQAELSITKHLCSKSTTSLPITPSASSTPPSHQLWFFQPYYTSSWEPCVLSSSHTL